MKDFAKKLKQISGCKMSDVADKFGVSRQFISAALNNKSLTYKASTAFYMLIAIDEKIKELEEKVEQLKKLAEEIKNYVQHQN